MGIENPPIDEDERFFTLGEDFVGPSVLAEKHQPPPPLIDQIVEATPRWTKESIPAELDSILERLSFRPRGTRLIPDFDTIPFFKRVGEKIERYRPKHDRNRQKGKPEAAEYGTGKIGDQDVVVYAMHYDFMGGSMSSVTGEKLLQAIELAQKTKRPLITIYSSGGARQDENGRALYQMERAVAGLEMLRESAPHVPNVAVLLGEVWGGVTASSVPRADLRVAYTGSRMGFAGPRVISAHEGSKISENAQRVEVHAMYRNVDVLVRNTDELIVFLSVFVEASEKPRPEFDAEAIPNAQALRPVGTERNFYFSRDVVSPPSYPKGPDHDSVAVSVKPREERRFTDLYNENLGRGKSEEEAREEADGQLLFERYRNLLHDSARIDTEMILTHALERAFPLYNRYYDRERNKYVYPAIIAGIGYIGLQPFMVVGDQPSYQVTKNEISKISASPRPGDLKYLQRMLNLGDRLRLPLVLLTDTPGAEPSLEAEKHGQFDEIAEPFARYHKYGQPILSIVTGLQGSGGGLVTSPRGDSLAILSKGFMTVAEPGSAAAIIYGDGATPQNLTDTIRALSPDSETQLDIGLVDTIIQESDSPYETVAAVRKHIIDTYGRLARNKPDKLHKDRWNRLRHAGVFKVRRVPKSSS